MKILKGHFRFHLKRKSSMSAVSENNLEQVTLKYED